MTTTQPTAAAALPTQRVPPVDVDRSQLDPGISPTRRHPPKCPCPQPWCAHQRAIDAWDGPTPDDSDRWYPE